MFAKKIISAFVALSFIFVAEAFARKSSRQRDDVEKTRISRKLKSGQKSEEKKKLALKAQQRKNLELKKRKQTQLKKTQASKSRKSTSSKSNRRLQKKKQEQFKKAQVAKSRRSVSSKSDLKPQKKRQVQPKKAQTSSKSNKPAPKVFKEPTPYYVKVRDLPKDQRKQAAKYMRLGRVPNEGTIKFAHSDLDPQKTPTFKEFLDIQEKNRKAEKKSSSGFEIFEYRDENNSIFYSSSHEFSSEYSYKKSSKKKSNWSWPWSR